MNFYSGREEKPTSYFAARYSGSERQGNGFDEAPCTSAQASNAWVYPSKGTRAAFVSHYEKMNGDKCFDTHSSTLKGSESGKDFPVFSQRSLAESSSSSGNGNYWEEPWKNLPKSSNSHSSVIYRPSFRLWKKCSATCAKTVTSVTDLYEGQNYFVKDRTAMTGQHLLRQKTAASARAVESNASGAMNIADNRYLTSERRSSVPISPSLSDYSVYREGNNFGTSCDTGRSNEMVSMLDKSAAVTRATNAAFEAILPYISFEEAQSLRDIITNQAPSLALSAVMQVAQKCNKTNGTQDTDSLQSIKPSCCSSHSSVGTSRNSCKLTRDQEPWLTDFSVSRSSSSEIPLGSPSTSSLGSSASGAVEPLASGSAWVSPFLLNSRLDQSGEPWDIEHCASEIEELDLLGKTLHEETAGFSGDPNCHRRSRFFPDNASWVNLEEDNEGDTK
jgi:hypothetical protein